MNHGDIPANSYGITEEWGYYGGTTTLGVGASTTVNWLTFTMPFTGLIVVHAALNGLMSIGGVQNVTAVVTSAQATPTNAPPMWARSEDGTASGYWHFTQPVYGYWSSVAAGTAFTVGLFIQNGLGAPTFTIDWICGTARCFRTS